MFLKAMLICDDVRVEVGGTLTLVGVHNERLVAPAGQGPITLARLTFLATVGGLRGSERVGYRLRLRDLHAGEDLTRPYAYERHDPAADEHNFVFTNAPLVFPGDGQFELALDVEAVGEKATYRYRFRVERAPTTPAAGA